MIQALAGITETEIANFLANTPGFFERHADLLASIQLTSPHGNRAVSLQERQMEMLRGRIRGLELKLMEMIRHGQENVAIADKLHAWTLAMLRTADARTLPDAVVAELRERFLIPQVALRLWDLLPGYAAEPFAQGVSADVRTFAQSLGTPYCGLNSGFEATGWLADRAAVMSMAMVPLRLGAPAAEGAPAGAPAGLPTFGLLVLGSPDATRFAADMGTDFLARIGELASAGLARLTALPVPP